MTDELGEVVLSNTELDEIRQGIGAIVSRLDLLIAAKKDQTSDTSERVS